MPMILILTISIMLQLCAAIAALRLIPLTGKRAGWVAIAVAILLMAFRRSITLFRLATNDPAIQPDLTAELVALAISVLMAGGLVWTAPLFRSISEMQKAIQRTNRSLRTLSECNQAIVRVKSEQDLMREICRAIVELGGYRLAWVGFAEHDDEKKVRPVAQCGFEDGYLEKAGITWSEGERGRGPTGTAIRTGRPSIARFILTDPNLEPWREQAVRRGFASSIALPLTTPRQTLGAMNIYAAEPDSFDEGEVKLLTELADDLSYAITSIRTRNERNQAIEAMLASEERYHNLFEKMNEGFALFEIEHGDRGDAAGYRFLEANPAFKELTQLEGDQVLGKSLSEVFPEIAPRLVETYGDVGLKGDELRFDIYEQGLDRYYEVNAFSPAEGQVATLLTDITERKRAARSLKASEERFRNIVQTAADAIILTDGDQSIILWTPAARRTFGYEQEEILGKPLSLLMPKQLLVPQENETPELADSRQASSNGSIFQGQAVHKNGSAFPIEFSLTSWRTDENRYFCAIVRDITKRKEAEQAILAEKRRIEAIIAHMADGVIMLDRKNRILSINPAARHILGIRDEPPVDSRIEDSSVPASLWCLACSDLSVHSMQVEGGGSQVKVEEIALPPPLSHILKVYSSPVRDPNGVLLGEVKVLQDVTRERELEHAKDNLIATVSHELRTPLFAIQGVLDLLLNDKVQEPDKQRDFLGLAYEQSKRQNHLLDALLDVARIEGDGLHISRDPIHIGDLLKRTIEALGVRAEDKNLRLRLEHPPDLPVIVGDEDRLGQAISNLIDNAIKFTPQGGEIVVNCEAEREEFILQVIDRGIGIAADALPHLFERFYQVDSSSTRETGGAGLGLYITKQIVEAHGGRIWVDSAPGLGSRFSFALPAGANANSDSMRE